MNREELIAFLQENLEVKTKFSSVSEEITVKLTLCGEEISSSTSYIPQQSGCSCNHNNY